MTKPVSKHNSLLQTLDLERERKRAEKLEQAEMLRQLSYEIQAEGDLHEELY
jgi:hypothetical protein